MGANTQYTISTHLSLLRSLTVFCVKSLNRIVLGIQIKSGLSANTWYDDLLPRFNATVISTQHPTNEYVFFHLPPRSIHDRIAVKRPSRRYVSPLLSGFIHRYLLTGVDINQSVAEGQSVTAICSSLVNKVYRLFFISSIAHFSRPWLTAYEPRFRCAWSICLPS